MSSSATEKESKAGLLNKDVAWAYEMVLNRAMKLFLLNAPLLIFLNAIFLRPFNYTK